MLQQSHRVNNETSLRLYTTCYRALLKTCNDQQLLVNLTGDKVVSVHTRSIFQSRSTKLAARTEQTHRMVVENKIINFQERYFKSKALQIIERFCCWLKITWLASIGKGKYYSTSNKGSTRLFETKATDKTSSSTLHYKSVLCKRILPGGKVDGTRPSRARKIFKWGRN